MTDSPDPREWYPTESEVAAWLDGIWSDGHGVEFEAEALSEVRYPHKLQHSHGQRFVRFTPRGRHAFYGYWQPAPSGPAPLVVHVPGYGGEMNFHPDIALQGFNVLHVNPLGYAGPDGFGDVPREGNQWPVLPDTVRSGARHGYRDWLIDCVIAVRWALSLSQSVLPARVSFFGTSQGGGAAVLLGSLYRDRGVRCIASDVPFLTDFPAMARESVRHEVYDLAFGAIRGLEQPEKGWRALGLCDTLSHAHRLDIPVLLTAGGEDAICPPKTIRALFERLPGTKMYLYLDGQGHDVTQPFVPLATSWFRLYA